MSSCVTNRGPEKSFANFFSQKQACFYPGQVKFGSYLSNGLAQNSIFFSSSVCLKQTLFSVDT